MSIYSTFAYAKINRWIADDLQTHSIMNKQIKGADGNMYNSIMPGGEQPEVADSIDANLRTQSYILYGVDNDQELDQPYKKCESLTYAILTPSVQKASEIFSCIQDLTGRQDWSVQDLNNFEPTSPFHFIGVAFEEISGFEPVRQEGGRYGMMVGIYYEYAFDNINGVPGSTGQGRRV